jgi:hypothetical protein
VAQLSTFGDMKRELTSFQIECERGLASALATVGRFVVDRRLDGVSETYITGSIEGRDIIFWIYADGADFHARHRHRVFERPDYDSLVDLACKFIEELTKAAQ